MGVMLVVGMAQGYPGDPIQVVWTHHSVPGPVKGVAVQNLVSVLFQVWLLPQTPGGPGSLLCPWPLSWETTPLLPSAPLMSCQRAAVPCLLPVPPRSW